MYRILKKLRKNPLKISDIPTDKTVKSIFYLCGKGYVKVDNDYYVLTLKGFNELEIYTEQRRRELLFWLIPTLLAVVALFSPF